MYQADAGHAPILGMDPTRQASTINRRLAYVPGSVRLRPNLTGGQVFDTLAGLRGSHNQKREKELIEQSNLGPTKRVRTCSTGNTQKSHSSRHYPPADLLILDEPTSGLAPLMGHVFAEAIRESAQAGTSILLSSHHLSNVQDLFMSHYCDDKEVTP